MSGQSVPIPGDAFASAVSGYTRRGGVGSRPNDDLYYAPSEMSELADYFGSLTQEKLAGCWVACIVHASLDRKDFGPGDLTRALVVVAERLHGVVFDKSVAGAWPAAAQKGLLESEVERLKARIAVMKRSATPAVVKFIKVKEPQTGVDAPRFPDVPRCRPRRQLSAAEVAEAVASHEAWCQAQVPSSQGGGRPRKWLPIEKVLSMWSAGHSYTRIGIEVGVAADTLKKTLERIGVLG